MTEDLTQEEMAAWQPFVAAATVVIGALDAEMKKGFGISHFDHALLLILNRQLNRRARMTDLARMLRVEPSNVTYRVRRLQERGLVRRVADPDDRRVSYAAVTVKGMHLLRDAWPLHRDGIRRHFLNHVRPTDLGRLTALFESIAQRPDGPGLPLGAPRAGRHPPPPQAG